MLHLNFLLSTIVQQYLTPKCVILITDGLNPSLNIPLGTSLVNVDVNGNLSKIFGNFGCQNFILNAQDFSRVFGEVEMALSRHRESFNERKYFVINYSNRKVFIESKAVNFVANLVVANVHTLWARKGLLQRNEEGIEVEFWTHPYSGTTGNNKPDLIDRWFSCNRSFLHGNAIFYDKTRNLQGRVVKVGVFDSWPYVILGNIRNITGAEIQLLQTVMNYINATLKFYVVKDWWGIISSNGSSFGIKGKVFNGHVDIGVAGIYLAEDVIENLDFTSPYLRADVTCLVPKPRVAPPWLSPYYSFTSDTWTILASTYATLDGVIYIITYYQLYERAKFQQKPSKVFVTYKTLVIVSQLTIFQTSTDRKYSTIKKLMFPIMLASIALSIAYTAGYTSIMTKPKYEGAINTVEDFLKSDLKWGGQQVEELIQKWRNGEEGSYKKLGERYLSSTAERLQMLSKRYDMAFKIAGTFGIPHIPAYLSNDVLENYTLMKEYLFTQYISAILRKNSVLMAVTDRVMSRMKESGIIRHWIIRSESIKSASRRKLHQSLDSQYPENLKLLHVLGPFVLLSIGLVLASILFCFEICKGKEFEVHQASTGGNDLF